MPGTIATMLSQLASRKTCSGSLDSLRAQPSPGSRSSTGSRSRLKS